MGKYLACLGIFGPVELRHTGLERGGIGMPSKRMGAEQIVVLLRQIEVQTGQGKTVEVACREAGISDKSYYRHTRRQTLPPFNPAQRGRETHRRA